MDRHQVSAFGRGSAAQLRRWLTLAVLATAAAVLAARPLHAQDEAAAPRMRSAAELEQLVGPIALYADDLIGIVLPASTYPLQVVQAARFLDARAKDSTLQPNDTWDDSVVALLNYPEVVKKMNDDLDWTYDLGEAVLNQRADVLDAVQKFRGRAYTSGNLRSDDKQVVANTNDEITIAPANPQVVYVPYYEPERVVVYQSVPSFYYYPYAYPLYYYPYPVGYAFHTGYFWGVTTAFVIGWHSHYVNVYHCGYYGHPYYGHAYHDSFYVRNDIHVNTAVSRSGYAWNPGPRRDGRPFVRSDDHYVRTPGSVRTPGAVHTPGAGTALRQEGRASGGTFTAPNANAGERSSAPARSGSYRNPGQTNGQTSFAAPPATRERPTTRPAENGNGAARGHTTPTPATPRDDAANRGGSSSRPAPDSGADPRRGVPERSMSLNSPSAQRYRPPASQYSTPGGTSQRALPTAPGSRGNGGVYRSGGSTPPPSEVRSWSAPSVPSGGGAGAIARPAPQAGRPAPSYNGGGGGAPSATVGAAPQGRSESRSSYAAPSRDSGGGDRSGGGQGGGSYRGGGGSHGGGGREASQHGSR